MSIHVAQFTREHFYRTYHVCVNISDRNGIFVVVLVMVLGSIDRYSLSYPEKSGEFDAYCRVATLTMIIYCF